MAGSHALRAHAAPLGLLAGAFLVPWWGFAVHGGPGRALGLQGVPVWMAWGTSGGASRISVGTVLWGANGQAAPAAWLMLAAAALAAATIVPSDRPLAYRVARRMPRAWPWLVWAPTALAFVATVWYQVLVDARRGLDHASLAGSVAVEASILTYAIGPGGFLGVAGCAWIAWRARNAGQGGGF